MKIHRRDFLLASSATLVTSKLSLAGITQRNKQVPAVAPTGRQVAVYTTAANTNLRISQTATASFKRVGQPKETQICVFVDPARQFQTFLGIGGALTDASAEVFAMLPEKKQRELLHAYFDEQQGIGYKFARTNIHSCDFSSDSYTYVQEGDKSLRSFTLKHDQQFRIPFIKKVLAASKGQLQMFASPWSPPAFMKTNNDMLHGGKLKPEFYQSWASYYSRFIKAYEAEGIPIWADSIQN